MQSLSESFERQNLQDHVLYEQETKDSVEHGKFWEERTVYILHAATFRSHQSSDEACSQASGFYTATLMAYNDSGVTHVSYKSRVHTLESSISKKILKCVREHITESADSLAVWHNYRSASIHYFFGTFQVSTDETTILLRANAIVAYPEHTVSLKGSRKCQQYLFDSGHTFVGFLHISTAEKNKNCKTDDVVECGSVYRSNPIISLADEVHQTIQTSGREANIAI